jgi:branched-chain amino acid transport system permease protein
VALLVVPLSCGVLGSLVQHYGLRKVHRLGHVSELLFTFGLAYLLLETVQLVWGRGPVPYRIPPELDGPLFSVGGRTFPTYRAFVMALACCVLGALLLVLRFTRMGLILRAALRNPTAVELLGHDVPLTFNAVFAAGAALAGLAGVVGGNLLVTEPAMAHLVGSIIFVVIVIGGMGSLAGAFVAATLIGLLQSMAVMSDLSLATVLLWLGGPGIPAAPGSWAQVTVAQVAPMLPYVLLVVTLALRPRGLFGQRED